MTRLSRRGAWPRLVAALLWAVEVAAAVLLVVDLFVVIGSVLSRYLFDASVVWSDDVARTLLLAVSFLGAAAALARGENAGVTFFVDRLAPRHRIRVEAVVDVVILAVACALAWNGWQLLADTAGQTVGAGIPQEAFFGPLCLAALAFAVFALDRLLAHDRSRLLVAIAVVAVIAVVFWGWGAYAPDTLPGMPWLMGLAFVGSLVAGMPIAFVLALSTLVYIWMGDLLPGEIFAQQMARGIDNFVLLAVPFFILVGYLMEANGMSVRLIALLQRGVGRLRGGLDVVMVLSMVVFSGISGSKMADVAAVGSVLVPAARKSGQKAGDAVALLAASAVMAETIPPCVNLIILGFVTNLSIGGLFMAGLLPSALMALALIGLVILLGSRTTTPVVLGAETGGKRGMWTSGLAAFGLIAMIFGGYRSGFATATEISAFAVAYAVVIGALAFRETSWRGLGTVLRHAAVRSGMVLFIVATAQSLAYVLTLQQIPHAIAELLVSISAAHGSWLFLLLSIAILIVMGSVLEGAAALIIFGPLLMPVARQLGIDPLHYGVVLVIGMGIGLFAPPLGLGLYGSCLIGGVKLEETVWPIMKYLGLLLACLILIALVPQITTTLPRLAGY
ncbi:MAG TPA: TRAP transporter large permease subunit [Aliidongia sp.]|uniref:TRAP transporter large permease n=1 Tax=Aliidongia sp. TaxID=1914230 RepID=UPI002DDD9C70|nr:TRAP transporter large permease subunit [Aliidongia sp.]HEV2677080.1 TRAP transporter large permease subunit [Aliidongia sp.]